MTPPISNLKRLATIATIAVSGIGAIGAINPANATIFGPTNGLKFNFTSTDTDLQAALDGSTTVAANKISAANGFINAATLWSSLLTDNVTLNIRVAFSTIPNASTTLGRAEVSQVNLDYSSVRSLLSSNITSADDATAVSSLTTNSTFNRLINNTSQNNTNGSDTYVQAVAATGINNVSFSTASAKALGLSAAVVDGISGGIDAIITMNDIFAWDFDRSNNEIDSTKYDFIGVTAHEIGHALGFLSAVDFLDTSGGNQSNTSFKTNTLDLFRYSDESIAEGAIDFTTGNKPKYFSIDNGATKIAAFANGATLGDGYQAGHWKDNLGIGIMDPTFANGELAKISQTDLRAFDVIGWDRSATSYSTTQIPEPSTWIGTMICAAFGTKLVIKRRQKLSEIIEPETDKDEA